MWYSGRPDFGEGLAEKRGTPDDSLTEYGSGIPFPRITGGKRPVRSDSAACSVTAYHLFCNNRIGINFDIIKSLARRPGKTGRFPGDAGSLADRAGAGSSGQVSVDQSCQAEIRRTWGLFLLFSVTAIIPQVCL